MDTLSQILEHKIVAIIRGAVPGDVLKIAMALHSGGVKVLEVTMNSDNVLEVIEQLSETMGDRMLIGAGTVLDAGSVKSAVSAGAKFIISPHLSKEIIQATKQLGAISIPGAYTATEIINAYNSGGDIIKIFPASGNVNYIKEIRAPLPHIPLMPTGGLTSENIKEFHKAGAAAFGIGTALVNTKLKITDEYLDQIAEVARRFVLSIANL